MKKIHAVLTSIVLISFIFVGCFKSNEITANQASQPQSVIIMISDGTGISHITALRYSENHFQFPRFPVVGLFTAHSLDRLITDSAASATAYAVGEKTNNGMIAMLPDGTKPRTVLELAEAAGKATGLVATSQITHATPAAFAAHVESRGNEMEIARQMARQEIEVLLGGGQQFFLTNDESGNLVNELVSQGYSYVDTRESLEELSTDNTEKVIGLFAESGMMPATEGRMPLELMAQKAVEILDNDPDGFFMMIEASQVDWESHDNDAEGILAEMKDMQGALRWILDYQQDHPEVLVVWISDHETGGVAVEADNDQIQLDFTSGGHTAQMLPALAVGPQADRFGGVYDNTDIGKILLSLFRN